MAGSMESSMESSIEAEVYVSASVESMFRLRAADVKVVHLHGDEWLSDRDLAMRVRFFALFVCLQGRGRMHEPISAALGRVLQRHH